MISCKPQCYGRFFGHHMNGLRGAMLWAARSYAFDGPELCFRPPGAMLLAALVYSVENQ